MTRNVGLTSRGRPPSFSGAPPTRLTTAGSAQKGRADQENNTASSTSSRPSTFPAYSSPFTPFVPCVPDPEKPSTAGANQPRSVVREYIRRGIYEAEQNLPVKSSAAPRPCANEERKISASSSGANAKTAAEGALPPPFTKGERPGIRGLRSGYDGKSFSVRTQTSPSAAKTSSGRSVKTLASASASRQKLDPADVNTLRNCILDNQRKLTELTSELKRIATPYTVKDPSAQSGETARCRVRHSEDSTAPARRRSRFPSAPAGPRRRVHTRAEEEHRVHSKIETVSRRTAEQRSQSASALSQQDGAVEESGRGGPVGGGRSASTPAVFPSGGATFRPSVRTSVKGPLGPITQTNNSGAAAPKNLYSIIRRRDLSKTLVRKEPLSVKQLRSLIHAWKGADQQLRERMDFWVRDLPQEVRNRVTAAPGVEKKFLALRDCVASLWNAAEERALAVLKMHETMADCKECYQSQQGLIETALVGVQGGLHAASAKIKQIDRLVRMQAASASSSDEAPRGSGCDDGCAGGYPFTPYCSVYTSCARASKPDELDILDRLSTGTTDEGESTSSQGPAENGETEASKSIIVEANDTHHTGPAAGAGDRKPQMCEIRIVSCNPAENVGSAATSTETHTSTLHACAPENDMSTVGTNSKMYGGPPRRPTCMRANNTPFDQMYPCERAPPRLPATAAKCRGSHCNFADKVKEADAGKCGGPNCVPAERRKESDAAECEDSNCDFADGGKELDAASCRGADCSFAGRLKEFDAATCRGSSWIPTRRMNGVGAAREYNTSRRPQASSCGGPKCPAGFRSAAAHGCVRDDNTVISPYNCDESTKNARNDLFASFSDTRTSHADPLPRCNDTEREANPSLFPSEIMDDSAFVEHPRWNNAEEGVDHFFPSAVTEQINEEGTFSVKHPTSPRLSNETDLDASLAASGKHGNLSRPYAEKGDKISPFPFSSSAASSSSSHVAPSPGIRSRGGTEVCPPPSFHFDGLPARKSPASFLITPRGPYQVDFETKSPRLCSTSEIGGVVGSSHVDEDTESREDSTQFYENQADRRSVNIPGEVIVKENLRPGRFSEDILLEESRQAGPSSGEMIESHATVSVGQAKLFGFVPPHQRSDESTLITPPPSSQNEDVSWAADLVSRWRAQRG